MKTLSELARERLSRWLESNSELTQEELARAAGHKQSWVSNYFKERQEATIDELDAMAKATGHTLFELFDLRPNPKENDLLDAYRAIEPDRRDFAIQVVKQLVRPKRGRSR